MSLLSITMGLLDYASWPVLGAALLLTYSRLTEREVAVIKVQEILRVEERCYRWPYRRYPCFLAAHTSASRCVTYVQDPNTKAVTTNFNPSLSFSYEVRSSVAFPGLKVGKFSQFAEKQQDIDTVYREAVGEYLVLARDHVLESILRALPPMIRQNATGREQIYHEISEELLKCLQKVASGSSGLAVYAAAVSSFPTQSLESTLFSYLTVDPEARYPTFVPVSDKLKSAFGPEILPFLSYLTKTNSLFELEAHRDSLELMKKDDTEMKRVIANSVEYL